MIGKVSQSNNCNEFIAADCRNITTKEKNWAHHPFCITFWPRVFIIISSIFIINVYQLLICFAATIRTLFSSPTLKVCRRRMQQKNMEIWAFLYGLLKPIVIPLVKTSLTRNRIPMGHPFPAGQPPGELGFPQQSHPSIHFHWFDISW